MKILLDKIIPNPEQPRREFDPAELAALTDSIRQHGVINPISVEDAGDHYILIDGERRVLAARLAGLTEIEASIRPPMNGAGSRDRLILALVANLQRSDMNAVEEARAFSELVHLGYSQAEIGQLVGLSQSNVSTRLRLLDLEPEIQQLFAHRDLPLGAVTIAALQSLPDESRVRIARSLAQKKVPLRNIAAICKRLANHQYLSPGSSKLAPLEDPQQPAEHWDMIRQLGQEVPRSYSSAAEETCRKCVLYDHASPSTCRDCPAVDLLRRIVEK